MAKKGMQIKYKSKKRERNKNKIEDDSALKNLLKPVIIVAVFLGVMYLMAIGLEKLGTFEKGYTAPTKETEFDYKNITISTVFNRSEKAYYVIFDNFKSSYTSNSYVNLLLESQDTPYYKVDMSVKENAKYASEESNKKATKPSELKINGITLIKIKNGKIVDYIEGSDKIEEYLK